MLVSVRGTLVILKTCALKGFDQTVVPTERGPRKSLTICGSLVVIKIRSKICVPKFFNLCYIFVFICLPLYTVYIGGFVLSEFFSVVFYSDDIHQTG